MRKFRVGFEVGGEKEEAVFEADNPSELQAMVRADAPGTLLWYEEIVMVVEPETDKGETSHSVSAATGSATPVDTSPPTEPEAGAQKDEGAIGTPFVPSDGGSPSDGSGASAEASEQGDAT